MGEEARVPGSASYTRRVSWLCRRWFAHSWLLTSYPNNSSLSVLSSVWTNSDEGRQTQNHPALWDELLAHALRPRASSRIKAPPGAVSGRLVSRA